MVGRWFNLGGRVAEEAVAKGVPEEEREVVEEERVVAHGGGGGGGKSVGGGKSGCGEGMMQPAGTGR
ncbi:uncharacterized protein A4U43_C06F6810 [Asparagus officinalis]|uniref:Uncharacterized protein n=1 Tax=Asparagus officinalis TaxID=4686 RepID=A0A5P1ENG8_ASPOF|nr:uncharacterized protein A4U43_C06F6810 [Asparagus officinalis]